MNRRIQTSFINRPFKTIIFIIIVSILFISLGTSFIWKDATGTIYSQINSVIKPEIVIKSDVVNVSEYGFTYSPIFDYNYRNEKKSEITTESKWDEYNNNFYNDLNTLIKNNNVYYADINMVNTGYVILLPSLSDTEFFITANSTSTYDSSYEITENLLLTNYNILKEVFDKNINSLSQYNRLSSVARSDFSDLFYNDSTNDKFIAGRTFTNEEIENGEYKIVLNGIHYYCDGETLKELTLGDTITYSFYLEDDGKKLIKSYEFEIIGIIEPTQRVGDAGQYNLIPEKTFLNIMDELYPYVKDILYDNAYNCYIGEYSYFPTYITLNSLDDLEKIINDINDLIDKKGRNYTYETNVDKYIVLAGNLESIFSSFNILYYFSIIASAFILFSLITIDVNNRKKEIGILMSLGEDRKKIAVGFILEYLFKILLSLCIALIISSIISNKLSDVILSSDIAELADGTSRIFFNAGEMNDTPVLSVNLSFINILKILLIVLVVSIPSIIFSVLYISHFNPKEVLKDE